MINYTELQEKLSTAIVDYLSKLPEDECKELMKDFVNTPILVN